MTDRERIYNLVDKECNLSIEAIDKITELKQENSKLKQRVAELEKPKKKRKFRAMTYMEYCKSQCFICEDCYFAPNWADKHCKHICQIWKKSPNDFNKPCRLPNGKYIFIEVKE